VNHPKFVIEFFSRQFGFCAAVLLEEVETEASDRLLSPADAMLIRGRMLRSICKAMTRPAIHR
jgi:hypothetical protein